MAQDQKDLHAGKDKPGAKEKNEEKNSNKSSGTATPSDSFDSPSETGPSGLRNQTSEPNVGGNPNPLGESGRTTP